MITVFGSINIDLVFPVARLPRPGETVLCQSYSAVPGGKGANQAVAAARAGAVVHMVGCVGHDGFGNVALAALAGDGIGVTGVRRVDSPTGCAAIGVDHAGENAIMVGSGANLDARAAQISAAPTPSTLILQLEVPVAEVTAAARVAKRAGTRVILNLAPAQPVGSDLLDSVDVLVLNEVEARMAAAATGLASRHLDALAKELAGRHGVACVITLGAAGAMAATPDGFMRVKALSISPVDTTAAGDAFVGILAAALDAGEALAPALRRASVGSSIACLTLGAQASLPTAASIAARLAEVPMPA